MKTINSLSVRLYAIAECFLLILNCAFLPASFAAASSDLNYSDLAQLASLETVIYGSAHKSLPGEKRIESLEKVIFGKAHSGSPHDRIVAIASAVNGQGNNLLAPPMAAGLDRSDTLTKTPSPPLAPQASEQSDTSDVDMPPTAQQDRIKIMLQQAMQLYSQGQVGSAETIFKNVLILDSANSDANFNLGAIAEGRSDWSNALRYYQAALKTNATDEDIKTAIQSMQAKIKAGQSIAKGADNGQQKLGAANKLSPQQIEALRAKVNQAASDYQSGNFDAAIDNLKTVASQAPDQADVQYALGQAYIAKGLNENARSALTRALFLAPDNQQYKQALFDLDQQMPPATANNAGDTYSSNSASGNGNQGFANQSNNQIANQNNGPAGGITPFTPDVNTGNDQMGWQSGLSPGYSSGSSFYTPSYMPGYASSYSPFGMSSGMGTAAMAGMAGMALGSMFGLMMNNHNYNYPHYHYHH